MNTFLVAKGWQLPIPHPPEGIRPGVSPWYRQYATNPPGHNLMLAVTDSARLPNCHRSKDCERCDHEFEVEVTTGNGEVDGCQESTADCGLSNPRERVRIIQEID